MTKDDLKNYRKIDMELRCLEHELEYLESAVYSVKAVLLDGMPKVAGVKDFSDLLIKLVDMKNLYGEKWDMLIDLRIAIERAIEDLPYLDRIILRKKYFEGKNAEVIGDELGYCERQVYRLEIDAIKRMSVNGGKKCDIV